LLQTEGLETRNLLTGGAGNTFGLLTGSITAGDKPAVVKFTVDPTRFELPGRGAVLGIDVAASSNSSLGPEITFVKGRGLDPRRATTATNSDAILAPINARVRGGQVRTYEVTVTSANKTTGQFLVGLYLPGDVDGNGVVNRTDLTEFKKAMGAKVGSPKYDFDADSNRDGVINRMDQQYVMKNQGVRTKVLPLTTANLDPQTDSGPADRATGIQTVRFSGEATPGATLTFEEVAKKTASVTATAGADGKYSVSIPLGLGDNTFKLSVADPFGQTMSGQLAKVTYNPALGTKPDTPAPEPDVVTPKKTLTPAQKLAAKRAAMREQMNSTRLMGPGSDLDGMSDEDLARS
jgi:hypothetical protein